MLGGWASDCYEPLPLAVVQVVDGSVLDCLETAAGVQTGEWPKEEPYFAKNCISLKVEPAHKRKWPASHFGLKLSCPSFHIHRRVQANGKSIPHVKRM